MPYTKKFIVEILQTFVKKAQQEIYNDVKVIPYQTLSEPIAFEPPPINQQWKKYYLLNHGENIFHALVVTSNTCTYVSVSESNQTAQKNLTTLIPIIHKAYGKSIQFSLSNLNLNSTNAAIGFIEALRQLSTQEKITTIDIHAALIQHTEFHLNQFEEKSDIINSLRLLHLYSQLIELLKTSPLQKLKFHKEKSNLFQQRFVLHDHLKILSTETLFSLINTTSSHALLVNLNNQRNKYLAILLQAEQTKFSKATALQKLIETSQILYHISTIGMYSELAVALPIILQPLFTFDLQQKIHKNITVNHLLKTLGILTGTYLLIDAGFYYAIKPPITYFGSQLAMHYLNTETFNDETGEVISSYLNYALDGSDWYLLISNLWLFIEALYSENSRAPIYAGLAIMTNLLFTQLAKQFLPIFNNDSNTPDETQTYTRMALLMLISLGSHFFSNTVVNYGYAIADEQTLCQQAKEQFTHSIQGQTTALEIECHSSSFWKSSPPKLTAQATSREGETFAITCDTHPDGVYKFSNCEAQKYSHKLLP